MTLTRRPRAYPVKVTGSTVRPPAYQVLADELRADITSGRLQPGERLPPEPELSVKTGVSRSTVREALKILASSGVVDIVRHRGAMIRRLSFADARDLLALLEVLTGLAARLAAEKINLGHNRALFTAAAKPLIQARPANELGLILDERARFYQTMLDIAHNEELRRAMPTWRAHLFRTQFHGLLTKADLKAMVTEYRQITQAGVETIRPRRHDHRAELVLHPAVSRLEECRGIERQVVGDFHLGGDGLVVVPV